MTGVSLDAEVSFSIGDVENAIHAGMKKHRDSRPKPSYLRKSASATSNGTNLNVLDLGSPPNGRIWQVISITLFGSDDHTAVASIVGAVYTGNPGNLGLSGLVVPSLVFPSYTPLPDKVLWVHSNENLCVQTSVSGTLGQQFAVNASLLEWRDHEISQRSGNY